MYHIIAISPGSGAGRPRSTERRIRGVLPTYTAESLVNSEPSEQLHAPTVGYIHLGPFCGLEVAFHEHTRCVIDG